MTQTELRPSVEPSRPGVTPRSQRGFTLIELMIVVAVVAILATVAMSSYNYAMLKSRRSAVQGCLTESAQFMERYYTTNMTYVGAALPNCSQDVSNAYTYPNAPNPPGTARTAVVSTATTYTLTAIPQGGQADDTCGTMTINQVGTRTPTSNCW